MDSTLQFINGQPCVQSQILVPVERPDHNTLTKHRNYAKGRADRLAGLPCASANGSYLDGWYSPERPFYFITETQAVAFGIPA